MRAGRRGFALIVALLTASAVFALAMAGAVSVRVSVAETAALRDRAELERVAHSVVAVAIGGLTAPSVKSVEESIDGGGALASEEPVGRDIPPFPLGVPLDLSRAQPEKKPQNSAVGGDGERTVRRIGPLTTLRRVGLPARGIEINADGERCRVSFIDDRGGVNLNTADDAALARFFAALGASESQSAAIADQIVDWRDEDDFVRPHGAERAEYERVGMAIRNAAIRDVSELLFLPAMTRELYERARRECCVEGDGRLHAGSAGRAALASLPGVTASNVEALLRLREHGEMLNEARVHDAMGIAAGDAMKKLRLEPTGSLRARVEFVDRGVTIEARVTVHETRGVCVEVEPL